MILTFTREISWHGGLLKLFQWVRLPRERMQTEEKESQGQSLRECLFLDDERRTKSLRRRKDRSEK